MTEFLTPLEKELLASVERLHETLKNGIYEKKSNTEDLNKLSKALSVLEKTFSEHNNGLESSLQELETRLNALEGKLGSL